MKQSDLLKKIDENLEANEQIEKAKRIFDEFCKQHGQWFAYIKQRWDDEREYEDWKEYVKVIMERMEGYEVKMVLKVGVVFQREGMEITVRINKRTFSYFWRELPQ